MDSLYAAWEGAEWIGAPHATVCAENRGVFTIESEFRMEGGKGEAGIVFGANDFRLNDHTKNELGMEGENYIRYAVCLEEEMHASKFTAWAMRRRIQRKNRLPLRNWSTGKRKHRNSCHQRMPMPFIS